MRPSFVIVALAGLLNGAIGAACSSPGGADPVTDAGPRPDAPTTTDGGTLEAGDTSTEPALPALTGIVIDEGGKRLAAYPVLCCRPGLCQVTKSGDDGRFDLPIIMKGAQLPLALLLKTADDGSARGSAILPVRFEGKRVDVGELFVPTLPKGAALGPTASDPQTVAVGDGLELTLRRGDLTAPLGQTDELVAARALPAERRAVLANLGSIDPIAAFALFPHGMTSTSKIGVRLPTQLPAGTKVQLHTVGELDGALSAAPIVAISDGNVLATAPGDGITELTWVIVSKSP